MLISAYLEAGRVLDMPEVKAFALKSLDRMLREVWNSSKGMAHVVAYGETSGSAARVAGVLDDYVFAGHAALDAWEATGELHYYAAAEEIAAETVARFYDNPGLAMFATEAPAAVEVGLGGCCVWRR